MVSTLAFWSYLKVFTSIQDPFRNFKKGYWAALEFILKLL